VDGGRVQVARKQKPDPLPEGWEDGLELTFED
jgi:hypothetical protein